MIAAAHKLKAAQIKMVLTSCGVPAPASVSLDTLASVPRSKVADVVKALAGAQR
jgi:hypothetical protein